jgi:hypothetical protein
VEDEAAALALEHDLDLAEAHRPKALRLDVERVTALVVLPEEAEDPAGIEQPNGSRSPATTRFFESTLCTASATALTMLRYALALTG